MCRAVLYLIGSQLDSRTMTMSVALLPAVKILRKFWSIRALD